MNHDEEERDTLLCSSFGLRQSGILLHHGWRSNELISLEKKVISYKPYESEHHACAPYGRK
jgi:hypothetical protein